MQTFHKSWFPSGSQHFCQIEFRLLGFSPVFCIQSFSADTTALLLFHHLVNILILRHGFQGSSDAPDSTTLQSAEVQAGSCEDDSARGADRVGHTDDAGDFGDIMDADDVRAAENGRGHCGGGPEQSLVRR